MDKLRTENIIITQEMLTLISQIDEFKGAWQALKHISPDRLTRLKKVATVESVGSSTRIEGSKLSDLEVEALLGNLHITAFSTRDEQEVAGYAYTMDLIYDSHEQMELSENLIKQFHRDLLRFSSKDERHRGEYKKLPNSVEAFDENGNSLGVIFQTASPFETPGRMNELVSWAKEQLDQKSVHPLLIIGIFIVVFLEIHPFQDGNGRLSRVLTTLLLLKAGYQYVPFCSLEAIIEQSKKSYYLALRQTQKTIGTTEADWYPWLLFFLKSKSKQVERLKGKMEQEDLLLGKLPELSQKILALTKAHGRISVAEIVNATDMSRNTIKYHLKSLTDMNKLQRHGAGRGTWYTIRI